MKASLRFLILTAFFKVTLCIERNIYISSKKSWSEAREYCRSHYDDLSSVNSKWEDYTLLQMQSGSTQRAWIGLYQDDDDDDDDDETWKWSGGENALFFNWAARSDNGGRCVAHDEDGWYRTDCEKKLRFYCFRDTMALVKENMTWEEAMEHCRQQHNDLISLPNKYALARAQRVGWEAQTDHLWIGLRYLAGSWLWVNGNEMKHRAWRLGEMPQCPASRHHCGALSLQDEHWDNWDCADKLNFVCY